MPDPVPLDEFYTATGRATAAWQAVEEGLRDIFSRAVVFFIDPTGFANPSSLQLVGSIFYASTNFRGTLQMVTNVLDQAVNDAEIKSEWNAISNKANTLYKRRNTIAHGAVYGSDGMASAVRMPILNPNARTHLNYLQVCACERAFRQLAKREHDLAVRINRHLGQRAEGRP